MTLTFELTEPTRFTFASSAHTLVDEVGLVFEKEIIHTGTFVSDRGPQRVRERDLDHWVETFFAMQADKVDVPVPVGHTSDPEKNRGFCVSMHKRLNQQSLPALFARIKFVSAEAAKNSERSRVSIHVPVKQKGGTGNVYPTPIQHIALTSYPVVSDLEPFRGITASLTVETDMEMRKLAADLSVKVEDGADDNAIVKAIKAELTAGRAAIKAAAKEAPKKDEPKPEPKPTPPTGSKSFDIPKGTINAVKQGRQATIQGLLTEGRITKAVFDSLVDEHCTDDQVTLSFSHDDDATSTFDALVKVLKANEPVISFGSNGEPLKRGSTEISPLVKDAEGRSAK